MTALAPPPVAAQPVVLDFKQLGDEVFTELLADDEAERTPGNTVIDGTLSPGNATGTSISILTVVGDLSLTPALIYVVESLLTQSDFTHVRNRRAG